MSAINQYSVFVSREGGLIDIVSPHGEIVSSIAVPAGRVRASKFLDLVPPGCRLEVAEGLEVFRPMARLGSRRGALPYGEGAHLTGANPDFTPTSATRLELQTRQELARLNRLGNTLEKRLKSLDAVERIPDAKPKPDKGEVVEDGKPKVETEALTPAPVPADAKQ